MPRVCPYCGIKFTAWGDYHDHLRTHQHKHMTPENTTGRSKAQIVADADATWLGPFLITHEPSMELVIESNRQEHLAACRCDQCLQKKLDELVMKSDAMTEELRREHE